MKEKLEVQLPRLKGDQTMKTMKAGQSTTGRKRMKSNVVVELEREGLPRPDFGRPGISRRKFLGASAASGAVLLGAGWTPFARAANSPSAAVADESAAWFDATTPQLQWLMGSGASLSRGLTQCYWR